MRTTLSLDDDVVAKLKARARRTGRTFKDVVNDALRRGLAEAALVSAETNFVVEARYLGRVCPGLDLDNIGELLDQTEGSHHR